MEAARARIKKAYNVVSEQNLTPVPATPPADFSPAAVTAKQDTDSSGDAPVGTR